MIFACSDGTKVKMLSASEVPVAYWQEHKCAWDYPGHYTSLPRTANDCYREGGYYYKMELSGNKDKCLVLIPLRYIQTEENELGEISL